MGAPEFILALLLTQLPFNATVERQQQQGFKYWGSCPTPHGVLSWPNYGSCGHWGNNQRMGESMSRSNKIDFFFFKGRGYLNADTGRQAYENAQRRLLSASWGEWPQKDRGCFWTLNLQHPKA